MSLCSPSPSRDGVVCMCHCFPYNFSHLSAVDHDACPIVSRPSDAGKFALLHLFATFYACVLVFAYFRLFAAASMVLLCVTIGVRT